MSATTRFFRKTALSALLVVGGSGMTLRTALADPWDGTAVVVPSVGAAEWGEPVIDVTMPAFCAFYDPYPQYDGIGPVAPDPPIPATAAVAWDLDGDGVFETVGDISTEQDLSNEQAELRHYEHPIRYTEQGTHTIGCRVELVDGKVFSGSWSFYAYSVSPVGPTGVSINNGAEFTNSRSVTLNLDWPFGTQYALISNDGGFSRPVMVVPDAEIRWQLISSLDGLFSKTVYVRFFGREDMMGNDYRSVQDDVILDTTPPVVKSAAVRVSSASEVQAAGRKIKVTASDDISGVAFVQINNRKSGKDAKTVKYGKPVTALSGRTSYIRAQDHAGNWSAWRAVQIAK